MPGRRSQGPRISVDVVQGGDVKAIGLKRWIEQGAPASARGSVTVSLVSDARVRALNRQYRKKDESTDVLSFPSRGRPHCRPLRTIVGADVHVGPTLGDIVIANGVAR